MEQYGLKDLVVKVDKKCSRGNSGYKSNTNGFIIGADANLNDQGVIGIAATHANSKIKMHDFQSGDSVTANTWMLSLYGMYDMSTDMFLKGIASFGTTRVKQIVNKVVVNGYIQSNGKYNSSSHSLSIGTGYRMKMTDEVMLVPSIGS